MISIFYDKKNNVCNLYFLLNFDGQQTISLSKQVEYLKHYKIHLEQYVGHKKADEILRKAVILLSMGTNDYLQNYFLEPTRPKQFTLDKYQDFLVSRMRLAIEVHQIFALLLNTKYLSLLNN